MCVELMILLWYNFSGSNDDFIPRYQDSSTNEVKLLSLHIGTF